jgi:hypothetical protein|tara:strand:- start:119 stop:454 length:336 start_codon:yes stop_codon:yes gene_type:complete
MVKIIDHQQTGTRKYIIGPGLKQDRELRIYENNSKLDKYADRILFKKFKVIKITDKLSNRVLASHLKKAEKYKIHKGIFRMYKRYGKLVDNQTKLIWFLQQRLKGVRVFKV